MKTLTRIRLINWHLFQDTTISTEGTTYFIGVNGVGKSTILDALQFALIGGQRDVRFNQAAMEGSRRTVNSYVRGELGTEGQRFLRGDATGVVALEFRNPDESYFFHGAVIDAFEDSRSPNITYFVVSGARLDDRFFFKSPGHPFDSRAFRRHIDNLRLPGTNSRAQSFSRLEDYRFNLLNRLGQLKETFPAKLTKGLAFSPLSNIREFVHNYLLDENLIDVQTLRDQLETLRHFEKLAVDIRQRIAALDKIEEFDRERQTQRRLKLINGYVFRRAQSDTHLAELKQFRQERDEIQVRLSRLELNRTTLNEQLKQADEKLYQARRDLEDDKVAARERELKEAIVRAESDLSELRQREKSLAESLRLSHSDLTRLQTLLIADEKAVPASLQAFLGLGKNPSPAHAEPLPTLQADLQNLNADYIGQLSLIKEKSKELREEAAKLQREINQLRTGDRAASFDNEAPSASKLRRLLMAQLNLGADEVVPLYDVLHIPDESWQNAVEGILGRTRFDLLVPPAHYDAAMRLYRDRRLQDNLHGVGLPDAERILQNAHPPQTDSLAMEVESEHPAAAAFISLLLGRYTKCDTLESLREHRTAVTRECFVRRNFTSTHLNPRYYRRWFIGERAIPRQIAEKEARISEIAGELQGLQAQIDALNERKSLTGQSQRYSELQFGLPSLARLPELEAELKAFKQELSQLDTRSTDTLKAKVDAAQKEVDALKAQERQLEQTFGSLTERLTTLEKTLMPEREAQAANFLQESETFLILADGEDLLDDAQSEYERRCERQPLETILTNAERYERDYENRESRTRDQLRDAKHAYSLAHQFGYDEDENAERYLKERERFIESELPDYEERIAHQRGLAEQELVENFIHRLHEQIEDARQQLHYLNTTLSNMRFGGERFEFIAQADPGLREVYQMIMDSRTVLGMSLFESDFRQRHQEAWDRLFDLLTRSPSEEISSELQRLLDYRNYLQYDIRVHYPNGDRALLSQINAKKSGGETTTPFYVAMAASFAQAYRLNQPSQADTIRLAIFDEAFGKMDSARTASALQFMVENQLQVILATPPDRAAGLLPHVDCVRTVVRQDNTAFVIDINKSDMMKELQS